MTTAMALMSLECSAITVSPERPINAAFAPKDAAALHP